MISTVAQLKQWFSSGLKPLQSHYHAWIDSFWHKDEKIPISSIKDLDVGLQQFVTQSQFNTITNLLLPISLNLNDGFNPVVIGLGKLLEVVLIETNIPVKVVILHNGTTEILNETIDQTTTFRLDRYITNQNFINIYVTIPVAVKIYTR